MLYEDDYVPVDGRIIHGKAVVNHTLLTGESGPIYAHTGDMLYSGAIIDEGSVTIEVTDIGTEAQYKKVLTLINNSWKEHLEAVNVVDKYYHTVMPYAIAASIMGLVLTGSFMTFITVLLIACPGPAYIAAPVAMRSAFITACNQGILLRNPDSLETIGTLDTMIFDKTGTLSTGHPQVVDIINTDFYSEDEVLAIAASCEKNQNHPVAKALLRESKMRKLVLKDITAPHYQIGKGISCVIDDKETVVGNAKMMADKNVILKNAKAKEKQLKQLGQSPVYVADNGKLIGLIGIKDTLRPETPSAIKYIHELGIQENEIISGDDQLIVANMAKELNINAYYGNMLPENKRDVIAALKKKHRITAMVGDGINDCAALSGAHIGITLADRLSRETLECSDVVIMNNNLQSIPALIDLGRFTESNMRQSYHLSVGLNIIGILLVFTNCINPFFASFYKDLNSLLVLINSLRPLKYKIKYLGVGE
jgi:cation-transporting P-type ATPase C